MTNAVIDNAPAHRFEIHVDDQLAGFVTYRRSAGMIDLVHTEIDDAFSGQGLAGELVAHVLDTVRAEGVAVLPSCPYVRSFIVKHPEYLDLVPADRRASFDLPAA